MAWLKRLQANAAAITETTRGDLEPNGSWKVDSTPLKYLVVGLLGAIYFWPADRITSFFCGRERPKGKVALVKVHRLALLSFTILLCDPQVLVRFEVMQSIDVWNVLTPPSTFQFLGMILWCVNHHPISLQLNQCRYQWVTYKMLKVCCAFQWFLILSYLWFPLVSTFPPCKRPNPSHWSLERISGRTLIWHCGCCSVNFTCSKTLVRGYD